MTEEYGRKNVEIEYMSNIKNLINGLALRTEQGLLFVNIMQLSIFLGVCYRFLVKYMIEIK